ncbi:DUF3016 domain-containing protein [Frateuria soli]|uniref:DUF3016 domain-containing protein n=1 Tax=Frateuria soli TaxID=1542730 RepID=UPI001E3AEF0E|nr:DUF3016 domain-containing protein [Frateuria soli]UGB37863.1 DUF3016 domain-containing protein [Frateuria soli]
MSKLPLRATLGLALALAVSTAAAGTVSVRYDHPENFTETKEVRAFAPSRADSGYLETLKAYTEKQAAAQLREGQTLDIVVTDIDRAGSYVPSMGSLQPVRVVKEVYPPRITLHFRLLDSQGRVLREGDRTLTDLGFMYDSPGGFSNTDPLRYEKRTIDRWLARGPAKL